jgi:hypothetical protein
MAMPKKKPAKKEPKVKIKWGKETVTPAPKKKK